MLIAQVEAYPSIGHPTQRCEKLKLHAVKVADNAGSEIECDGVRFSKGDLSFSLF